MMAKLTKELGTGWVPTAAIAVLGLGSVWLIGDWLLKSSAHPPIKLAALTRAELGRSVPQPVPLAASVSPTPATQVQPQPEQLSRPQPSTTVIVVRLGALRVSNPTDYPIRVALLAKTPIKRQGSPSGNYDIPAHWDFAPQEGSAKGLLVSLPDRTIRVKPGDILVAFAQDGSRRYWGPYVVGETDTPTWNPTTGEWRLVLQP